MPWLGIFNLMSSVDKYVFLDDVQLSRPSWQTRNRIKLNNKIHLISIPIRKERSLKEQLLNKTTIDFSSNWQKKHLNMIFHAYKNTDYLDEIFPMIEDLINNDESSLSDFNINISRKVARQIGINPKFHKSSELKISSKTKDHKLVAICKVLECETYLSPPGSAKYIEEKTPGGAFIEEGINLFYHNYEHPIYPQINGDFISHLSIIDLLMNIGLSNAKNTIISGAKPAIKYDIFREKYWD